MRCIRRRTDCSMASRSAIRAKHPRNSPIPHAPAPTFNSDANEGTYNANMRRLLPEMNDPLLLFADDRIRARDTNDPWANLCVLSTIDAQNNPQARVGILRDLERSFAIFINATSPKHREVALSHRHTVLVYFASLGVQHRLTVLLEPVAAAIVHKNSAARPPVAT